MAHRAGPRKGGARQPIGYHAGETTQQEVKWVQVDLGKSLPIESVQLYPMTHVDVLGFGFPVRFKIAGSNDAGFATPTLIADQTGADFPMPAPNR